MPTSESVDVGTCFRICRINWLCSLHFCQINRSPVFSQLSGSRGLCGDFSIWYSYIWVGGTFWHIICADYTEHLSDFKAWRLCGNFWIFEDEQSPCVRIGACFGICVRSTAESCACKHKTFRAWELCGDFCISYSDILSNQEDSQNQLKNQKIWILKADDIFSFCSDTNVHCRVTNS